jgi:DNA-binding NarL/FixJ family response regulator
MPSLASVPPTTLASAPAALADPRSTAKARIVVIEDHPFVRHSIVTLINGEPDLACCAETDRIAQTPALVAAQTPNLILMDLRLSDGEAFGLIRVLGMRFPEIPILVVSQYEEVFYASKALAAGARGYLMKHDAPHQLLHAIRTVLAGRVYLSESMALHLLNRPQQPAPGPACDRPANGHN